MASPTAPPDTLRHLSFISSQSAPHVLTIGIDSNVVEVTAALLFDVLLLSLIEYLCQAICAHHNLYRVYDSPSGVLPLRARRLALFGDGLIGAPWLSSVLTVVLALVVASNIIVGFAVTGRSEPVYHAVKYAAVVGTAADNAVLVVDPTREISDDVDNYDRQPTYLSSRLVALKKMDWCQTCNYTHCTTFAYAYENDELGTELVHVGEAYDSYRATCVSGQNFRDARVMATPTRVKQKEGWCGILEMDVDYNNSNSSSNSGVNGSMLLGIGNIHKKEYCHFDIQKPRCIQRPKHETICATIGQHKRDPPDTTERYLMLMNIPAGDSKPPNLFDVSRIAASVSQRLHNDTWERYMETAAFMAAVGLGPAYMLQLMPFATFSANQTLLRRDVDNRTRNVSDVDLRVALPGVVVVIVTAGVLLAVAGVTWGLFVRRYDRGGCNAFASVTELVEVMVGPERGPGTGTGPGRGKQNVDWGNNMGVDDMDDNTEDDSNDGWFTWGKSRSNIRRRDGERTARSALGRDNMRARVAVSRDGECLEVSAVAAHDSDRKHGRYGAYGGDLAGGTGLNGLGNKQGEDEEEGMGEKEKGWEQRRQMSTTSTTGSGRNEWKV